VGDRLIDCDQRRVVTSCPSTRSEYETSWRQSDHETIMIQTSTLQLSSCSMRRRRTHPTRRHGSSCRHWTATVPLRDYRKAVVSLTLIFSVKFTRGRDGEMRP
jgi:hypothetical protein